MRRLLVVTIVGLLALPLPLWAADKANTDAEGQAKMDDMVVTATRTEEPLKDIPGRVEVITRTQLDQMPVQTVDEALSYISGAHSERPNGVNSFKSTLVLRGLGNEQGRTLVLLDGMPMNSSDMGDVNWNRINMEDVQRIEVLKGPAASIYGNNAMGGVINIITQKPTKHFEGRVSSQYGTYDDWQVRAVAGFRAKEEKEGLYGRLSTFYHNSPGYKAIPYQESSWYTVKNNISEKTINGKVGWDFTETNNIEVQYTSDSQEIGEGTKILADNGVHRGYETGVWNARMNLAYEGWSGSVGAYFSDTNYDRTTESISNWSSWTRFVNTYSRTDSKVNRQEYGILTNVSRVWGPNTFTVGFDYHDGLMDGRDYGRTTPYSWALDYGKIRGYGVFAQDQLRFFDDKLIILGGLRYDNTTTYDGSYATNGSAYSKYTQAYSDHTWDQWSPRASAKYFFMDNLSAYASYGHSFRAPLLDDMYRTGKMKGGFKISNPNLGAENMDSFEVGMDFQPIDTLKLSASGYHSIGHDFQYYVTMSSGIFQKQNVGEVSIWGYELNAEFEPFKHVDTELFKKYSLFGNFTHNDSQITKYPTHPELVGKYLSYTPQNSFNVGYTWLNKYINNRFAVQFVDEMYSDDANTASQVISAHALLNTKLWRNFDFISSYGKNVELAFTVENLLNYRYIDSRNSNGMNPGRTMYLELSCKF
ncbi:MAG: TonB-dependent receptor [Solidesulfovibrio sp.]